MSILNEEQAHAYRSAFETFSNGNYVKFTTQVSSDNTLLIESSKRGEVTPNGFKEYPRIVLAEYYKNAVLIQIIVDFGDMKFQILDPTGRRTAIYKFYRKSRGWEFYADMSRAGITSTKWISKNLSDESIGLPTYLGDLFKQLLVVAEETKVKI